MRAAFLVALLAAPAAAQTPAPSVTIPRLNVEAACRNTWTQSGNLDERMFRHCMQTEQTAYNALRPRYATIAPNIRAVCENDWAGARADPSYRMLRHCIDRQESAAAASAGSQFRY